MPEAQSGYAALPREVLKIASGYAFAGPALDLGALLWDGVCLPDAQVRILLPMLNRHGLVAGATGTGKTKTLQLEELLTGLGTGEAVVTVLSEKGAPTPVAATRLRAPESLMGPVDAGALDSAVRASPLYGRYAQAVDRESAYERLSSRGAKGPDEMKAAPTSRKKDPSVVEQVVGSGMFKSLTRSLGTQIGREITRSLFGTARRRR